jgi:hypothetical protein
MTIGEKCYEMFQLIINIINKSKCNNQGRRNDKKARGAGANAHQRAPLDSDEDINLQLCVDLPMKANTLNQVTFKITPHDFAQKASLEM